MYFYLATVIEPMRCLLLKQDTLECTSESQKSFNLIKDRLSGGPILFMFDTHLVVVGPVLRTVAFASRNLSDTEHRYFAREKKGLACHLRCGTCICGVGISL